MSVELSVEDRLRIDAAALLKKKANKVATPASAPAKAVVAQAPTSAADAMMTETEKAQLVGVDMDQMMA